MVGRPYIIDSVVDADALDNTLTKPHCGIDQRDTLTDGIRHPSSRGFAASLRLAERPPYIEWDGIRGTLSRSSPREQRGASSATCAKINIP